MIPHISHPELYTAGLQACEEGIGAQLFILHRYNPRPSISMIVGTTDS